MEGRVGDGEIAVAHGAVNGGDGVAGGAAEAILRLGSVDLFANGAIEAAVEEDGVVVTAGAELAAPGAVDVLHVLDGFSVELIVERREVVHGTLPLAVGIFVTLAAALGIHEEGGGDDAADIGDGGRGVERRLGSAAFTLDRDGGFEGIVNGALREIGTMEVPARGGGKEESDGEQKSEGTREAGTEESGAAGAEKQGEGGEIGGNDVEPESGGVVAGGSHEGEVDARGGSGEREGGGQGKAAADALIFDEEPEEDGGESDAAGYMEQDEGHVENGGGGEGGYVSGVGEKDENEQP